MKTLAVCVVFFAIGYEISPSVGLPIFRLDECSSHTTLDDETRLDSYDGPVSCDQSSIETGWYRFKGMSGTRMSSACAPVNRCGARAPGWMNGSHPVNADDGIVEREVCFHWGDQCCYWRNKIKVRLCPEGFFVYELSKPPVFSLRYCGNSSSLLPVNGDWSHWTDWSECSKTCFGGEQWRTRTCTNPPPVAGGADCPGSDMETRECNMQDCPVVDGGWGKWSKFGPCSKSCGGGKKEKARECNKPAPANGGKKCKGKSVKRKKCNKQACGEDGARLDSVGA